MYLRISLNITRECRVKICIDMLWDGGRHSQGDVRNVGVSALAFWWVMCRFYTYNHTEPAKKWSEHYTRILIKKKKKKTFNYDCERVSHLRLSDTHHQISNTSHTKILMFLNSSCSCLCPVHWSQMLIQEWKCSWSSADRRCAYYI